MTYNPEHRSEIATAKLVKAWIERRLYRMGVDVKCGCALTQIGGGFSRGMFFRRGGYSIREAFQIHSAFETGKDCRRRIATFDDLLRTVQCIMELDKEYYERKPILITDEIILEEVERER